MIAVPCEDYYTNYMLNKFRKHYLVHEYFFSSVICTQVSKKSCQVSIVYFTQFVEMDQTFWTYNNIKIDCTSPITTTVWIFNSVLSNCSQAKKVCTQLLGDQEVTANLYCNFAYLYWEGCVICSVNLRYFLGHPVTEQTDWF